jgi:hypothetical protein
MKPKLIIFSLCISLCISFIVLILLFIQLKQSRNQIDEIKRNLQLNDLSSVPFSQLDYKAEKINCDSLAEEHKMLQAILLFLRDLQFSIAGHEDIERFKLLFVQDTISEIETNCGDTIISSWDISSDTASFNQTVLFLFQECQLISFTIESDKEILLSFTRTPEYPFIKQTFCNIKMGNNYLILIPPKKQHENTETGLSLRCKLVGGRFKITAFLSGSSC